MKKIVEDFLKKKGLYNGPLDWLTDNRFVDNHGCDGYIFNNSEEAIKSILSGDDHQNAVDFVDGACTDDEWIAMLIKAGYSPDSAYYIINNHKWDELVKIIVYRDGPEWFLSTYSGNGYDLPNGMILYY